MIALVPGIVAPLIHETKSRQTVLFGNSRWLIDHCRNQAAKDHAKLGPGEQAWISLDRVLLGRA